MKRVVAMALIASTLLAGLANSGALASGAPAKAKQSSASEGEAEASARTMDAPYLAAPIVREGRLAGYFFISLRFEVAPGVDLWATREKAHFLRDALVRAGHAHDLSDAAHPNVLDEARAIAVYRAAAAEALGARAVSSVEIIASYSSRAGAA
jgi:hypothetical protein